MTVDFCEYFWGDKYNGFSVLYHNMKYGLLASKDLADFFRERSSFEENASKLLARLAKQAGNSCTQGSFSPMWQILKTSAEKLSTLHLQMVQKCQELIKDIHKYSDELQKKQKAVKEEESGTLETVCSIQTLTVALQKAKEVYTQRSLEYEKLKAESTSSKELEKAETKLKKAYEEYKQFVDKYNTMRLDFEHKMDESCRHFQNVEEAHLTQMRNFLTTYTELLIRGHELMGEVHMELQEQCGELSIEKLLSIFIENKQTGTERPAAVNYDEDVHISGSPIQLSESNEKNAPNNGECKGAKREGNSSTSPAHEDNSQCSSFERERAKSVGSKPSRRTTSLLNLFIPSTTMSHGSRFADRLKKRRGVAAPPPPPHPPLPSSLPPQNGTDTPVDDQGFINKSLFRSSKWFLKSRRDKKDKKKKKKKNDPDNSSSKEEKSDGDSLRDDDKDAPQSDTSNAQIDDEGFSVRPKFETKSEQSSAFFTSSDSDSDDEREKKIHINIKPLANGANGTMSASVGELRGAIENWSIAPVLPPPSKKYVMESSNEVAMKRSQSTFQNLGSGKPSQDLIGLNLFQSPPGSVPISPNMGKNSTYTSVGNSSFEEMGVRGSPGPLGTGISGGPKLDNTPTKSQEFMEMFSELGEMPPALPPKQNNTSQSGSRSSTPVQGTIAIPRPPSRRGVESGVFTKGRMSPATTTQQNMSRTDSCGNVSMDFRSMSRGPSPLTIGMADTIPIAVAFQEVVNAVFRGADEKMCRVKESGDVRVSFPAGILQVLTSNPSPPQLTFRIKNTSRMDSILANRHLITSDTSMSTLDCHVYQFNMPALISVLKKQMENNNALPFFTVEILKYQVKTKTGAASAPFQMVAHWKCEPSHTDLRISYKYNSHALSIPLPFLNLIIAVPVDGDVKKLTAEPEGEWKPETMRALWNYSELSHNSENSGVGNIKARFELNSGPSCSSTVSCKFSCEGATLSGIDIELVGAGYRLSLIKKRFTTGNYVCESDDLRGRYAAPPGATTVSDC